MLLLQWFKAIQMEKLKISTSAEYICVPIEEIVCIIADGNYCELVLTNGRKHIMTFQLHYFEEYLLGLKSRQFERVGRSLIVNTSYVRVVNIPERMIRFGGPGVDPDLFNRADSNRKYDLKLGRDSLREFKQKLEKL